VLDEKNIPAVELDEIVARYLQSKRNIRADKSIKPDEFVPFSQVARSVNRHRDCSEDEIWQFGRQVAAQTSTPLLGRTDVLVSHCTIGELSVKAAPVPGNPNHADIVGYPSAKSDQKALALKIAANASDQILPPESHDQVIKKLLKMCDRFCNCCVVRKFRTKRRAFLGCKYNALRDSVKPSQVLFLPGAQLV